MLAMPPTSIHQHNSTMSMYSISSSIPLARPRRQLEAILDIPSESKSIAMRCLVVSCPCISQWLPCYQIRTITTSRYLMSSWSCLLTRVFVTDFRYWDICLYVRNWFSSFAQIATEMYIVYLFLHLLSSSLDRREIWVQIILIPNLIICCRFRICIWGTVCSFWNVIDSFLQFISAEYFFVLNLQHNKTPPYHNVSVLPMNIPCS